MRVHVKGDILGLPKPSSAWLEHFKSIKPFPVRLSLLFLGSTATYS